MVADSVNNPKEFLINMGINERAEIISKNQSFKKNRYHIH